MQTVMDQLIGIQDSLPAKQRSLCRYIVRNAKAVSFMPIGELSERAAVGRATVMRFLESLGFNSYIDFKRELNSSSDILFDVDQISNPFFWSKGKSPSSDSLIACFEEVVTLMRETADTVDRTQFQRFIDLLLGAHRVNTLGFRTSGPLARYTSYQLEYFLDDVRDLSGSESLAFDRVLEFNSGDVLLIISSNPTTTTTIRIAELCKDEGVPVLVITDDPNSALLKHATLSLCTVRSDSTRLSVLPHMLILEAIFNELGIRTAPVSVQIMNRNNQFLFDKNIIQN